MNSYPAVSGVDRCLKTGKPLRGNASGFALANCEDGMHRWEAGGEVSQGN